MGPQRPGRPFIQPSRFGDEPRESVQGRSRLVLPSPVEPNERRTARLLVAQALISALDDALDSKRRRPSRFATRPCVRYRRTSIAAWHRERQRRNP